MLNKNEIPFIETKFRLSGEPASARTRCTPIRGSVRELERIANKLRGAGEHCVSESIDLRILALLEQKIYRKIITKSRGKRPSRGRANA